MKLTKIFAESIAYNGPVHPTFILLITFMLSIIIFFIIILL